MYVKWSLSIILLNKILQLLLSFFSVPRATALLYCTQSDSREENFEVVKKVMDPKTQAKGRYYLRSDQKWKMEFDEDHPESAQKSIDGSQSLDATEQAYHDIQCNKADDDLDDGSDNAFSDASITVPREKECPLPMKEQPVKPSAASARKPSTGKLPARKSGVRTKSTSQSAAGKSANKMKKSATLAHSSKTKTSETPKKRALKAVASAPSNLETQHAVKKKRVKEPNLEKKYKHYSTDDHGGVTGGIWGLMDISPPYWINKYFQNKCK